MGQRLNPATNPVTAAQVPPEYATQVAAGVITAAGPTAPIELYGSFNLSMWASETNALTTVAGQATKALFGSATGLAAGETVISTLVPPGTTVLSIESTITVTLGGMSAPQIAALTSGTDAAAVLLGCETVLATTVQLEKSYDGGTNWMPVNLDKAGTIAKWQFGSGHIVNAVTFSFAEVEKLVGYRLNAIVASGNLNYRFSSSSLGAFAANPP